MREQAIYIYGLKCHDHFQYYTTNMFTTLKLGWQCILLSKHAAIVSLPFELRNKTRFIKNKNHTKLHS